MKLKDRIKNFPEKHPVITTAAVVFAGVVGHQFVTSKIRLNEAQTEFVRQNTRNKELEHKIGEFNHHRSRVAWENYEMAELEAMEKAEDERLKLEK